MLVADYFLFCVSTFFAVGASEPVVRERIEKPGPDQRPADDEVLAVHLAREVVYFASESQRRRWPAEVV